MMPAESSTVTWQYWGSLLRWNSDCCKVTWSTQTRTQLNDEESIKFSFKDFHLSKIWTALCRCFSSLGQLSHYTGNVMGSLKAGGMAWNWAWIQTHFFSYPLRTFGTFLAGLNVSRMSAAVLEILRRNMVWNSVPVPDDWHSVPERCLLDIKVQGMKTLSLALASLWISPASSFFTLRWLLVASALTW